MTIASTPRRAGPYATNGVQTDFAFAFKVFEEGDVLVVSSEDGLDTNLTLGFHYTVELNEDQDNAPGGTVTLLEAPDGPVVNILGQLDVEQPVVITNRGGFFPRVFNDVFDRLTIYVQQIMEKLDRALLAPLDTTAVVGQFPYVLPDGRYGFSTGTGSDPALRSDLAANANDLVRTIYPGYPAIISTLGDWLPTVAASTFFGIRSNGSTDDTVALNNALVAMSHSTNPRGKTLFMEPGEPTVTSGQIDMQRGVVLDLRGGYIASNLSGSGNEAGVRAASWACIRNGAIRVTSTGSPASQGCYHAPLMVGVGYGEGGTIAARSPYDQIRGFIAEDLELVSDKNIGVGATSGALAIAVIGDVAYCTFQRIKVPDSDKLQGAVSLDWGIVGDDPLLRLAPFGLGGGGQGLMSNSAAMHANKLNYDDGYAFTTCPHDIVFRDFDVGQLTRAFAGVDTGSFAARLSGAYGILFENWLVGKVTEAAIVHHVGDLGYEFADPSINPVLYQRGNRWDNFRVLDAHRGYGIKFDALADNVWRAIQTPSFTASIAGTTLTVTAVASGQLVPGQTITATGIAANTKIVQQLTGTEASTGTYEVSISQTLSSRAMTATIGYTSRLRAGVEGAYYETDAIIENAQIATTQGVNANNGAYVYETRGGRMVDVTLSGFKNNVRVAAGARDFVIERLRATKAWEKNVLVEEGAVGTVLRDTKQCDLPNQSAAGGTTYNVYFGASDKTWIDGGEFGLRGAFDTATVAIASASADDGCTNLRVTRTPRINSAKAAGFGFVPGAGGVYGTLDYIDGGIEYDDTYVATKQSGQDVIPTRRRVDTGGNILREYDMPTVTPVGLVVRQGDIFNILDAVSGQISQRRGVASGTVVDLTAWNTLTKTTGTLS